MLKLNTAGSMRQTKGDSIFQCLFIYELQQATGGFPVSLTIQYGKKASFAQRHPYGDVQLTKNATEFLLPLLASQDTIFKSVNVVDACPEDVDIDIDAFRNLAMNFAASDIRLWPYALVRMPLPMDLQRRVINVKANTSFNDYILLTKTSRYNNVFLDWSILKEHKEKIIFMRTPRRA